MRWQIEQFIFCDQQQVLIGKEDTYQLEPMMVELLVFFCQHPAQIISKQRLIEEVWLGRIVNDNTVSKLVTKLRKVFHDDVRQPRYIATFPKKGYKFIARVDVLTQSHQGVNRATANSPSEAPVDDSALATQVETQAKTTGHHSLNVRTAMPWLVVLLAVVSIGFWLTSGPPQPHQAAYAKAVTSEAGDELFPAFSPDGSQFLYMADKDGRLRLMLKDVASSQLLEIQHGDDVGVGPGDWSKDGKQIVYLVANPERCQYFRRTVDDFVLGEPQLLHNCPAGSYGKILFTHDNDRLVFSENHGPGTPHTLFELDLSADKVRRLNQPEPFIGGNSQFDLHPFDNKLLLSSPDRQQWEGFYSLDLDNNKLTELFKLDAYICCGIWDHQGERVVMMGEHPAYQLLSYDLSGEDIQVVYASSRRIGFPTRHANGVDYLFSSGEVNLNVHLRHLDNGLETVLADASVDELLPTFAYHSDLIAYVSLASGSEEIWLKKINSDQATKLTRFNDSRHYLDLVWSPDGGYLAALTLNEIHLINPQTGESQRLRIPQTEIRGVSFKSDSELSYSISQEGEWRVFSYLIDKHQVVAQDPNWQFVHFHPQDGNTLWMDQAGKLFAGAAPTLVEHPQLSSDLMLHGRRFNLRKRGDDWYWFTRGPVSQIKHFSPGAESVTSLRQTGVDRFDVRDSQLLFGLAKRVSSNIFQTQSHR